MRCPKCGLFNPDIAQRCDCGYDFAAGVMRRPYGKTDSHTPEKQSFWAQPHAYKLWAALAMLSGFVLWKIVLSLVTQTHVP
jgi:hypothetical protein